MKKQPVRPKNFSRPYTKEDDEFIEENAHRRLEWIAQKLERPIEGLRVHMIELGVSNFYIESNTYSAKALGELIGVSHETVRRWIMKKGLPAVKRARRNGVDKRDMNYHITVEDFWKWAEQHKDFVEFNKIERDILPPEPEWVEEERRKQFHKPPKQKIWTPEEDELAWSLYISGIKIKDIAFRMNRTLNSVERRLQRLRRIKYGQKVT